MNDMKDEARKSDLVQGFICTCGEEHRYPPYVYAHWDVSLAFTCPKCEKRWEILRGHALDLEDS